MLKILLVEDDKTIVANLTKYLNGAGYIVRSVSGQSAAMAALAEAAGAGISLTDVQKIAKESSGIFRLDTDDGEYCAKAVIYACGARPRTLGLPGEAELVGHGISYCALCDGSFFKDQDVTVVGGGNSAFDDALLLSERCHHVTLIHRRSSFRAEQILVDRVKQRKNISLLTDTTVSELIQENGQLTGLKLKSESGKDETLPVSGLFAALGRLPDTQVLIGLAALDENGYVFTDGKMAVPETPGLFAAGLPQKKRSPAYNCRFRRHGCRSFCLHISRTTKITEQIQSEFCQFRFLPL